MITEFGGTIRARGWRRDLAPRRRVRGLVAALLALLVAAGLSLAQAPRARIGRRHAEGMTGPRRERAQTPKKDQHPHAPDFMKRLRDLPPEEQERILANDERFQRLPRRRQEQIRKNLRRWNALSPEQKQRLRERQEIFESLSPQQRKEARAIFQQWRELSPGPRQELMQAFRRLRDLPPNERQRYLSGPEMEKQFSPEERGILGGLSKLLPASPGGPPHD